MYIKENNLLIRNACESDTYILCSWWNDGNVMAHAGFPKGLMTTEDQITKDISLDSDETKRRLIIEIDNMPVGEMSYRNIGNNTAEIGIKICNPKYQNNGYGTRLLSMFIKELFQIGYKKIILDTNLNNTRAQHVYEKLGFRKVQTNIDSFTDQLGILQSSVNYELEYKNTP